MVRSRLNQRHLSCIELWMRYWHLDDRRNTMGVPLVRQLPKSYSVPALLRGECLKLHQRRFKRPVAEVRLRLPESLGLVASTVTRDPLMGARTLQRKSWDVMHVMVGRTRTANSAAVVLSWPRKGQGNEGNCI